MMGTNRKDMKSLPPSKSANLVFNQGSNFTSKTQIKPISDCVYDGGGGGGFLLITLHRLYKILKTFRNHSHGSDLYTDAKL